VQALISKPIHTFFDNDKKQRLTFCHKIALDLLTDVVNILDNKRIIYHLEGGTLLGIVRDNKILPWDDDLDISVPEEFSSGLWDALKVLKKRGWKLEKRRFDHFSSFQPSGTRLIRVRDCSRGKLHQGTNYLDIFIKCKHQNNIYWQAKGKLLMVDKKFYQHFDTISFNNLLLKVPSNYKDYLTEKYGDWSIPVKEWDCSNDEKTIVE
jgi:phosphorylcholine metabolism protein LicD